MLLLMVLLLLWVSWICWLLVRLIIYRLCVCMKLMKLFLGESLVLVVKFLLWVSWCMVVWFCLFRLYR